jgi:hypothetical protein
LTGICGVTLGLELEETKLTHDGIPGEGDWFGYQGSLSGHTALVSQRLGGTGNIGGAHVFVRVGLDNWSYQANLADHLEPGDIIVSGGEFGGGGTVIDGDTAIVAAYRNTVDGVTRAGNAFVFTRSDDAEWTREAELLAPGGPITNARFGAAADLDGDHAILTASGSSKAYIFHRTDSTWDAGTELTGGAINESIGAAISGEVAVVGTFTGSPHADIWRYNVDTEIWAHESQIANPGVDNLFGTAVDISGDTLIVSARSETVDENSGAGAAYVYRYDEGTWTLEQTIENPEPEAGDEFGYSVAIDGDTVIIGAARDDGVGADSGSAYIYKRTDSTWSLLETITASDGAEKKWFGQIVGVDGRIFLAGGPGRTTDPLGCGDAYVYEGGSLIPGDANGDNKVDDQDASILAAHWQMSSGATWEDGDFNNDGKVDDRDASILAAHWQEGTEGTTSVPEPTTLVLLAAISLLALPLLRRRRCPV